MEQTAQELFLREVPAPSGPMPGAALEAPSPQLEAIRSRRTRRVRCLAAAQLQGPEGRLNGVCDNISLGGLLFVGPLLSVGQQVGFSVELPQLGTVFAHAEVLEHRDHPTGFGMALRFLELSQRALEGIARFVADQVN